MVVLNITALTIES